MRLIRTTPLTAAPYEAAAAMAGELVAVDVTVISTANQTAAAATVAKIDAIGNVTKDSGTKITGARDAYDALTDGAKKLVSNLQTLIDAEEAFKNLSGGDSEADKKAADDVIAKIDEIGAIGKDSGAKITEAENAYNELNDAAKGLVGDANYKKLTDAKAAQTVYDQIEALFPVSADSKNAIAQAEARVQEPEHGGEGAASQCRVQTRAGLEGISGSCRSRGSGAERQGSR